MSVGNVPLVQNTMKRRQCSSPGMSWIVMTRHGGSQMIIAQFSWLMQFGHHYWFMDRQHVILHHDVARGDFAKVAEVQL